MSKVYLVGAGPGDPELITVKGRRVLARADAVLYDALAPEALLDLAPPHAERIYVGKKKSVHAFAQEEICAMMIERAQRGLTVVRLKGGDPFIFGRGGEELEALAAAGVAYEVVPGVTSALGIAAYTGVPLTHREHNRAVSFVTGHDVNAVDWGKLGPTDTLIIFMGIHFLREIAEEIVKSGRSPATPAMVVRWGTRPDQQTVTGTVANIADVVAAAELKPPATVIIGDVVGLRDRLSWFEKLPFFGKRVVVTRAREQAPALAERLHEFGADVIELPVIELQPPCDAAPLARAIEDLASYDWVIFTSANGVRFFLEALDASRRDLRSLRARLCAIGPATRAALEAVHLKVDLTPEEYVAESVAAAFAAVDVAGARVLLPRAAKARDVIPAALRERGAQVDVVEAYRTVLPREAAERARKVARADWITFTSSSTVENLLQAAGEADWIKQARVACIGPVTSETARRHGLRVDVEAETYTVEGLVEAMVRYGTTQRSPA